MSITIAQTQTVGTFTNTNDSYEGYNLLAPMSILNTYLIDNCGNLINEWHSDYRIGLSAYLLEDGSLLRTAQLSSTATPPFSGGGTGGRIERFSWDGDLTWSMNWADSIQHQHHDIEWMPNGHILILAWEKHSYNEALSMGLVPNSFENDIWCPQVTEISPTGIEGADIIWQWSAWDHLIQDFDSLKLNFGVISENPRKFNINYLTPENGNSDWMHCNAIDFNVSKNTILVNSANFCEFWIIDHNNTTEGASTQSGDLLYRYGNPESYDRGGIEAKSFFFQHDTHWVDNDSIESIMVFNNGPNRPEGNFSTIEIIELPQMINGTYPIDSILPFNPSSFSWSYPQAYDSLFYANRISGANRLPNGNTLICNGPQGNIFEVDSDENVVWEYVNPMTVFGPTYQGNNPGNNSVFRMIRYGSNYIGFDGKDLTPGDPIEQGNLDFVCTLQINPEINIEPVIQVHPNPFTNYVSITFSIPGDWQVINSLGVIIDSGGIIENNELILGENLSAGYYIITFTSSTRSQFLTKQFIKI